MWQDLRFSWRLMTKEPWFAAAVVVTLALGMGVNAVGFTIVNSALLRGQPFPDAQNLYTVYWQDRYGLQVEASYPDLRDWREASGAFEGLAAYRETALDISGDQTFPERVSAALVTANAFDVLRVQPLLGRGFAAGEDSATAEPVVVISASLWSSRFGSDPGVVGKTLRVDGRPATVIGVMRLGMSFPERAQIWAPFVAGAAHESRTARMLGVFGRAADTVDERAAAAEIRTIALRLAASYPAEYENLSTRVETFAEAFVGGPARTMFGAVMAAAAMVLAIACFNVANLMLARSTYRVREIAVRAAIGATRWRVVRQLLVESAPLAAISALLGLLLAYGGISAFDAALQDSDAPPWLRFAIDGRALVYIAAFCFVAMALAGIAPALRAAKVQGNDLLREASQGKGGRRTSRLSGTLVVAQLALTVALLAAAGLLGRSLWTLYSLDTGLDVQRLMAVRIDLPESRYGTAASRDSFLEQLRTRLAANPSVRDHAVTTAVPPSAGDGRRFETDGGVGPVSGIRPFVSAIAIDPDFFAVVERPVARGRGFDAADAPGDATVIVNEQFAERFFPGEDVLGKRLRFVSSNAAPGEPAGEWRTVIGVSAPIPHGSARGSYSSPIVYLPYRDESPADFSLLIRSDSPPAAVLDSVRAEMQALDRDLPVSAIQTLADALAANRWPFRVFGLLFGLLALIATTLSCVGLYAVMAYSVAQRRHEIGVRIAIGAQGRQVSWLVLKRGLVQLAAGLALGLAGAFALGIVLRRILVVEPADPLTLVSVTLALSAVALTACVVPARRAARVDPLVSLRVD